MKKNLLYKCSGMRHKESGQPHGVVRAMTWVKKSTDPEGYFAVFEYSANNGNPQGFYRNILKNEVRIGVVKGPGNDDHFSFSDEFQIVKK